MDNDNLFNVSNKDLMGERIIKLGNHWSFNLKNDPKRLAFVLSRYKFAAKTACKDASILELGCSEGIGAAILSEFAQDYIGIDMDTDAILTAEQNWAAAKVRFIEDDFIGKKYGLFDAVISLDVIEHIQPESQKLFFETVINNLLPNGKAVIGTPNITADEYASEASKACHVNLFSGERLQNDMLQYFDSVLMFGVNDEVVHTGFLPMCHYLICIGIGKVSK